MAEGGSPALVIGADGCPGVSGKVLAVGKSKTAALEGGLRGWAGTRRGGRRLPKAALPRSCSVWAGVREAGWGCRRLARSGRRCWGPRLRGARGSLRLRQCL